MQRHYAEVSQFGLIGHDFTSLSARCCCNSANSQEWQTAGLLSRPADRPERGVNVDSSNSACFASVYKSTRMKAEQAKLKVRRTNESTANEGALSMEGE